jgi:hypothetical protein
MNRSRLAAAGLILALMLGGASAAGAEQPTRTIATYPPGTFLENLAQGPDGEVVITNCFDRTLLRWLGEEAPSARRFWTCIPSACSCGTPTSC